MARLIVPELSEMNYRKKLLEHAGTMSFHHGTVPFPEEEWPEFYREWVGQDEKDRYFAYIYCGGCEDFTGMVSYHYDENEKGHVVDVLVEKARRHCGYGSSGIRLLQDVAKQNDISRFIAPVEKGNDAAAFFENLGFTKDHETADAVVYTLEF